MRATALVATEPVRPPRCRAECISGPRPCPWVGCRYHLGDAEESCALDVAAWGGASITEIASIMKVSKQRIHQLTERAVHKLQMQLVPRVHEAE